MPALPRGGEFETAVEQRLAEHGAAVTGLAGVDDVVDAADATRSLQLQLRAAMARMSRYRRRPDSMPSRSMSVHSR
jgi:hypothetical protein